MALFILAHVSFLFALLSKPSAVAVPLILLVLGGYQVKKPFKKRVAALLPMVLIGIPLVFSAINEQTYALVRHVTPVWARPFVALDSLAYYFYKLCFPVHLAVDYGRAPDLVLSSGTVFATFLFPIVAGIVLWKLRGRYPYLGVAALAFTVSLLTYSGLRPFIYQTVSTVSDRYMYLSMLGAAFLIANVAAMANHRRLAPSLVIVLILGLSMKSRSQMNVWSHSVRLWEHTIDINPASWLAFNNLASIYEQNGQPQKAIELYVRSAEINPRAEPYGRSAVMYIDMGEYEKALPLLDRALEMEPRNLQTLINKGHILSRLGRNEKALDTYRTVLRIDPQNPSARQSILRLIGTEERSLSVVDPKLTSR